MATQQHDIPLAPAVRHDPGTPLARIVLGVLLGMIAYTVLMAVVGLILAATVLGSVLDDVSGDDPATPTGTLSEPCQAAIANGTGISIACEGDDPALIQEYRTQMAN